MQRSWLCISEHMWIVQDLAFLVLNVVRGVPGLFMLVKPACRSILNLIQPFPAQATAFTLCVMRLGVLPAVKVERFPQAVSARTAPQKLRHTCVRHVHATSAHHHNARPHPVPGASN